MKIKIDPSEERLTIDRLNDDGCLNLIEALVADIGQEYRNAYFSCKRYPNDNNFKIVLNSIRFYLLSLDFFNLTGLRGSCFIGSLDKHLDKLYANYLINGFPEGEAC